MYAITGAALTTAFGLRGVDFAGAFVFGAGVALTSASTSESSPGSGVVFEDDGSGVAIWSCSGDSALTALALALDLEAWTPLV